MKSTATTLNSKWLAVVAVVAAGMLMATILLLMTASARAVVPQGNAASTRSDSSNTPTVKPPAANKGEQFAPGRVIVKFKKEVGREARSNIRSQEKLAKKKDLGLIKAEVDKIEGRSVQEAVRELRTRPEVEFAEPDFKVYPLGYADEPRFEELWGLNNTGQDGGSPDVDINGLEASVVIKGDSDLAVAVIDDGVDFEHPDLQGHAWTNPDEIPNNNTDDDANGYIDDVNGFDFANDDNTVHDPAWDFHGTHVAGTIAASVNDQGVVGVAPNAKIMALKFLGPEGFGYTSDAIEAIKYAKNEGARISNNSWGGGRPSRSLKSAIDNSGSLFVAAAGNWGINDDSSRYPNYPSSYNSQNILAVAAVNSLGRMAPFSNYGATSVDISAPGVGILSSVPGMPEMSAAALSSVGPSGKALTVGFGADEIGDSTTRQSFFTKAFGPQGVLRGSQEVVLVDDDQSDAGLPDAGRSLKIAIQGATGSSVPVQEIDVPYDSDGPSLAQLQGNTVVWATGLAFSSSDPYSEMFEIPEDQTTLTPADQETLKQFVEGGGKLVITGMDALFLIEDSPFVTDTLKLDVMSDIGVGGETFEGASGTAFDGESYTFNSSTALAPYYHDRVAPASSAGSAVVSQGSYPEVPGTWESWSGTSMAAPHATGTAALVASVSPAVLDDPVALKGVIMNSGKPLSATVGKTVTGDMVDAKKAVDLPIITAVKPTPGSKTQDRTPTIGATVWDDQTDLAAANIEVKLDGKPITAFTYDQATDRLSYTSKKNLAFGSHTVRVEATDAEQNEGWRQWTFKVIQAGS